MPGRGRLSAVVLRIDEPWALAFAAALLTALALLFLPAGTDAAAHRFQRDLFIANGFTPWNNLWYGGRYSFVTYSLVYYPLAALVGIGPVAVLSAAAATAGASLLMLGRWGRTARWASRAVAPSMLAFVLTGTFPFLLGTAFATFALYAAQRRSYRALVALGLLTVAASPLAFALLALVVLTVAIGERPRGGRWIGGLGIIAGIGALQLLLDMLFPSGARSPFATVTLVEAVLFCGAIIAVCWRVPSAGMIRWAGIVVAGACLVAFLVPSPLGDGITRFRLAAVPIAVLALSLRRWRPVSVSVAFLAIASVWSAAPVVSAVANGLEDPSGRPKYWAPTIAFLQDHLRPGERVEVVDTERHWAAAYLPAAGIPIARGWFRQDDFPGNAVLYRPLTPLHYRTWLRGLAVRYVVLPDADLDYSAQQEAALLRDGRSGLRLVRTTRHTAIYEVPVPRPLVSGTGRARVVSFTYSRVVLHATPGRYRVAVRGSPYWHASPGCVSVGSDGMLRLVVRRSGRVTLRFAVDVRGAIRAMSGRVGSCW